MIFAYILLAILILLGLFYALRPLLHPVPAPFPQSPRPEELRAEVEVLKAQAREAQGEERKRLLAQAVRLERELAELGSATPATRRLSPALLGVVTVVLLGLGVGLWQYTVPRLPGESIISARKEARELGLLEDKAKQSGKAADWLAFANKAYDLQDYERAANGYVKVAEIEPSNVQAIRRLGILLFMSGRADQAISILQIATHADPSVAEGWLFLGNAYFQQKQPKEAIAAWEGYLKAGGEAKERVENLIQTARAQLANPAPASSGQQVFLQKCAACHGASAQGGTGPALKGNPVAKVPEAVSEIVSKGRGKMPAVALSEAELKLLLDYLRGL